MAGPAAPVARGRPPAQRAAAAPPETTGTSAPAERKRPAPTPTGGGRVSVGAAADTGAGFVLALLVWGWVIMPFLRGGPAEVRKTLKAKFVNKGPDGGWLP